MYQKIVNFMGDLNKRGIPIPLIRDPQRNEASVTLTMFVISFVVVTLGLIGKLTRYLDGVDLSNGLWLFGMCGSLYLGKHLVMNGKGSIDTSNDTEGKN